MADRDLPRPRERVRISNHDGGGSVGHALAVDSHSVVQ
jgi:hypothetical protein